MEECSTMSGGLEALFLTLVKTILMKYIQTFLLATFLMSFSAAINAQSSHVITIRVTEANHKKLNKIIVADKDRTMEVIEFEIGFPLIPEKFDAVLMAMAQVLDKYISEGYKIVTSNGGIHQNMSITNYVLIKE